MTDYNDYARYLLEDPPYRCSRNEKPIKLQYTKLSSDPDAIRQFADYLSFVIAYIAEDAGRRPPTDLWDAINTIAVSAMGGISSQFFAEAPGRVEAIESFFYLAYNIPRPHQKGHRKTHSQRDEHIFAMRLQGFTYGQIAQKLRLPRHVVVAAFKREKKHRDAVQEALDRAKPALKYLCSIYAVEEPAVDECN